MRRVWRVGALLAFAMAGCGRGPFFDVPVAEIERCAAVDFLFVIDNSESMQRHQDNLRASFDPFIEGIYDSLDDVDDYHVGVVTTDSYRDNEEGCRELGALVTSVDDGMRTEAIECGPFAEGNRYMTEEDDLAETFNCAAAVGTDGSRYEAPMKAMRRAISGETYPWYRECNGDFIRDDALLVTVIITDEAAGEMVPDANTEPDTDKWYDTVVDTKGNESNAVVVSLLNGVTPGCPTNDPDFDGKNIADFTNRFTHGFVGGICEQDYGNIFARAVEEIDSACTTYTTSLDR